MEFRLYNKNQLALEWDQSQQNKRIVLTETHPFLAEDGLKCFGYYANKSVQPRLTRGHHGSCYEFHYIESGAQPFYTYESEDAPEESARLHWVRGGDVFITRPYEYHSTGEQSQQRGRVYWLQIDSDTPVLFRQTAACSELLREALGRLDKHVVHIPQSTGARLSEACALMTEPDDLRLMRAYCLLTLFVFELSDLSAGLRDGQADEPSQRGQKAAQFIKDNLTTPGLDLAMVAEHMHYSRSYTATIFKSEIGMTVHEFITRSKIDMACELLRSYSVVKVAAMLNFSSSQHFCKIFKEQVGVTPSEFVLRLRGGQIEISASAAADGAALQRMP